MPRPSKSVPSYRLHKQSGQAVVTIRTPGGGRRDVLLGKYNSPESRAEYARIVAQLQAGPAALVAGPAAPDVSVNEVILAFMKHADRHYRRADGTPTVEIDNLRLSLRPLRELYGHTLARELGPLALKTVRQKMVTSGLARDVVNQRVGRIKRVFKWAASEELVPVSTYQRLATVTGLQRGRTAAPDPDPIGPVEPWVIDATVPHLPPELAAMVRVQVMTGMRPGEVCRLRRAEVSAAGPVWRYTPPAHKSAHRGKTRTVAIGPKAQALLAPFWPADPTEYAFSPRRVVAARRAADSAARKTPRWASHMARNAGKRKAAPKRQPGERYRPGSYAKAVAKAVERANAANRRHDVRGGQHGPDLPAVPHWHPNQLRHTFATVTRRAYGLEAVQVLLGHSRADVTQVYAERDLTLAERVAAEIG